VVLTGNTTLANPTNVSSGQTLTLRVKQDGTGSRTMAYGSQFKFSGGVAPVLSTAANALDVLTFQYDGIDDTYCLVASKTFS
jgi:lipopolysaccharide export system protein LptA